MTTRRPLTARIALACWLLAATHPVARAYGQEGHRLPRENHHLEISLPGAPRPVMTMGVRQNHRATGLVRREQLKINDPQAAEGVTAVDVWADLEAGGVKFRLSIIYNDLSDPEWWKDKREKILGEFAVPFGQTARPGDLGRFGLEPLEMKGVHTRIEVFAKGQGPKVTNQTESLEVIEVEKFGDYYGLLIKNNSGKEIISVSYGSMNSGYTSGSRIAGGDSRWEQLHKQSVEGAGITIKSVLFADGSYEGNERMPLETLAAREGARLQSPHILRMIRRALEAGDDDLERAVEKLEADLGKMREAVDKPAAVELLKSKFGHLDERAIDNLYESLKRGLYDARNGALGTAEQVKKLTQHPSFAGEENRAARLAMIRGAWGRTAEDLAR